MDEIDLLYDKRINCPICNNEFLTKYCYVHMNIAVILSINDFF